MSMYDKIAKWHKQGLWSAKMVDNAVVKGILTGEQAAEIKGGGPGGSAGPGGQKGGRG